MVTAFAILVIFFHNAIGDLSGAKIFHVNSGGEKLSPESHTFVTFEEEEDIYGGGGGG